MIESHSAKPTSVHIEQYVATVPNTLRGIDAYSHAFGMEDGQMDRFMHGNIGDLGSGCDGLAASALRWGLDCRVYSINPQRTRDDFLSMRQHQYEVNARDNANEFFEWDEHEREQVLKRVDETATADYAHKLSFPNGFFDTVFDSFAVMHYSEEENSDIYRMALDEVTRVVRPGGNFLVIDWHTSRPNSFWYRDHLLQRGWRIDMNGAKTGLRCTKPKP